MDLVCNKKHKTSIHKIYCVDKVKGKKINLNNELGEKEPYLLFFF